MNQKKFFIMRHADAIEASALLADFERPLSHKGEEQTEITGNWLKQQNISFDCIMSSSALRAYQTSVIIAQHVGYHFQKIEFQGSLYYSNVKLYKNSLSDAISRNKKSILIIGHNPTVGELARSITAKFTGSFRNAQIVCFVLNENVNNQHQIEGDIEDSFFPETK